MGDFGSNEFLFNQIDLHISPNVQGRLFRPKDGRVALVKGALAKVIDENYRVA